MAITPPSTPPWHVDPAVYPVLKEVNQCVEQKMEKETLRSGERPPPYLLAEGGQTDYEKVFRLYDENPIPGRQVMRVRVVDSESLLNGFEAKLQQLHYRGIGSAFQPRWDLKDEARLSVYMTLMKRVVSVNRDARYQNPFEHAKVVSMWHATNPLYFDSIFRTGFANLATTDPGFFGKGLYFTSCAPYTRVYGGDTLLFTWVSFFSPFPVVDGDMDGMMGKNNVGNHDAHYVLVGPKDPNNPNEVIYVPIKANQTGSYANQKKPFDELVVFESTQALPRYIVELGPTDLKLHRLGTATIQAFNAAIKVSLERSADSELNVFLTTKQSKLSKKNSDLALCEKENRDFHIINIFNENQDSTVSQVLIELILGRVTTKPKENSRLVSDNHYGHGAGQTSGGNELSAGQEDEYTDEQAAQDLFDLGIGWRDGVEVTQNDEQAVFCFDGAAERGHAGAQYNLGVYYDIGGGGLQQNYKRAEELYRSAAEKGDPDAQCALGIRYIDGMVIKKDYRSGVTYLLDAVEQGHAEAEFRLSKCYKEGWGVKKSAHWAKHYLIRAADQKHDGAMDAFSRRVRKRKRNKRK